MKIAVVYDACVLHPAGLRDLLVRLAMTGMYRAHWSEAILDEMVRSIRRRRPDLAERSLDRTRFLMCNAVPDCIVSGYEHLESEIGLPDDGDRHVLAAAIHSGSQIIVTDNLADFPASTLDAHGIEAQTPDEFILQLMRRSQTTVERVIDAQVSALRNPPLTYFQLLDRLERSGLRLSAAALRVQRCGEQSRVGTSGAAHLDRHQPQPTSATFDHDRLTGQRRPLVERNQSSLTARAPT